MPQGVTQPPLAVGVRGLFIWWKRLPAGLVRALLLSLLLHGVLLLPSPWPNIQTGLRGEGRNLQAVLRPPALAAVGESARTERLVRSDASSATVATPVSGGRRLPPPEHQLAASKAQTINESADELDAESLTLYRLALARALRGLPAYPEAARSQRLAGVVEIAIIADPVAAVPLVVVEQGSGYAVLDQAALALINRAVRTAPLPAGMPHRPWRTRLPVHFSPTD
jgi:TonB family protein